MIFKSRTTMLSATFALTALLVVSFSGCIGLMSQMMYVIKGHNVPAAYDGLENQRVAIVCVSDVSAYGPDNLSYTVSRAIGIKLAQGVKKIKLVPSSKVESWIDQNGWDELDFEGLAKGIGADRVIAVELASYSIKDGATMYKGRSDVTVTVYDLDEPGSPKVAYGFGPQEFEFPKNGRPAIQTSDRKFEAFYLSQLTQHITNHFVEHDRLESVAVDAMMDSDF